MTFRAAAVQIAPIKAEYETNLGRVAEAAARCSGQGADVVIFPETALSGYFLEGGVAEVAVSAGELAEGLWKRTNKDLRKSLDCIVGFYERNESTIYNSAAHISLSADGWKVLHVHRKFFLPTYGVFDEERFVARGRDISAYETRFGKFAMLICEDVWHSISGVITALKGAEVIVAISASPARGFSGKTIENLDRYRRMLRGISEEHGVWVLNAMLVGFEGGKGFTGGSMFVAPDGCIVAEGPIAQEHILIGDVDLEEVARVRQQLPLLADLRGVLEDIRREFGEVDDSGCR